MALIDSLFITFSNWLQDPFFYLIILGFLYVCIFSYLENKNEQKLQEYLSDNDEVIYLPKVSVKHLQKFIGIRRDWFKADVYFTLDSIFVFGGGGRFTLHSQYYFNTKSPPEKQVWLKNSFLPVDKIFWDKNDLHICYLAPHWPNAKCTTILKDVSRRKEIQSIQQDLHIFANIQEIANEIFNG